MRKKAVLTTIPSDAHSWNLVFMQMFLEESGFRVINLGVCVPFDQVIQVCSVERPDLVVVSTTSGHGYMEGAELARRLGKIEHRAGMKLVIGGKLGVDQAQEPQHSTALREAGFDEVFYGASALDDFTVVLGEEKFSVPAQRAQA